MREWTHRRLLVRFVARLGATIALLVSLGLVLGPITSWEFSVYVGSLGALIACFGIAEGCGRFCARVAIAPTSRPGIELRLLPMIAAALPVYAFALIAREPDAPRFVTIALTAAATALFLATLSGCRTIARARAGTPT